MKFQLNDYVTYTNKAQNLVVSGPIIAMSGHFYVIAREEGEPCGHWRVRERSLDPYTYANRIHSQFRSSPGGWIRTNPEVALVTRKSRNVKSAILKYDPKQQGDRDDDI